MKFSNLLIELAEDNWEDQEDRARAKLKMLDFGEDSLLPGEIREFINDHRKLAA